ncbi:MULTISPECIES: hypothetical protein [Rhizobium]|uniref:hypothetical protein n=1 Tax=Rhizobium TaxID=379 RepID=UPI00235F217A|nr:MULTISPECIES: hypothetical protein [unclassified Rhizobium]MDC9808713.1 hypothetical protein [Rhizobium sp. MC62]WEA25741.1 hypothetical protein PO862_22425 [Rhizobium sp. MJ22]
MSDLFFPDDDEIRGPAKNESLAHLPIVNCLYKVQYYRECYRIAKRKADQVAYGENMKYVHPVAFIPPVLQPDLADEQPSDDDEPYDELRYEKAEKGELQKFRLKELSPVEEATIPEVSDIYAGEDSGYALIDDTEGGQYVLDLYGRLANRLPKRECTEGEDYCSVVLRADHKNRPAFVYCQITNSALGVGLPFNCDVVAFQGKAGWYVYGEMGPAECDGCGAVSGASCYVETKATLDDFAEVFSNVVKKSKIDISLEKIPNAKAMVPGTIKLGGFAKAKESKFYKGYYEKASANYSIYENEESGKREIHVDGLYVLLVSSEPSLSDDVVYHDIPTKDEDYSNIEWLQKQISEIYEKQLAAAFKTPVMCDVAPIY